MTTQFFDKVAKKFGEYRTGAKYTKEFLHGDPEARFKEELLKVANKDAVALDVGCADGRFTLSISDHFKKMYAIDTSKEMLESAKSKQKTQHNTNVEFQLQNAKQTSFADNFFDVIYNRRGPTYLEEYHRLLKPHGRYLNIAIGEKDTVDLKKVFGRGQNYGEWEVRTRIGEESAKLEKADCRILYAADFEYSEYYETPDDLNIFLQGVPIFEDYDEKKDAPLLKTYVEKFSTQKGILLSRHRTVFVAEK